MACNVMSCEEVNTIACEKVEQEASRMMIYVILNKSSEACHILVKSLEKHNPFLFHDPQVKTYAFTHINFICFAFVFFISLTSTRGRMYETVCDQLLFEQHHICKRDFMKMLLTQRQRVLFLLDGYDEFKPQKKIEAMIKENHKFKNIVVIIATRTESIHKVGHFGLLIAETGDLSEESYKKLIKNVLMNKLADGLLNQVKEATSIKNLMKTLLFVITAYAIQMGENNSHPVTQTLFSLYNLMVEKNRYKTKGITENNNMLSINHCGDLALDGIFDQRFDFQSIELTKRSPAASGLLNKYTAQRLKPTYRFFHKSFQEYTASRKLCKLLTSCQEAEVKKRYIINTISDITNTYFNLLLYTCGSSLDATRIILDLVKIDQHRDISQMFSLKNLIWKANTQKKSENITEKEDLNKTDKDIFADYVINFLYENSSKSSLSRDFEEVFCDKSLYINTQNIPIYFFFRYLANCVSVLAEGIRNLRKLHLLYMNYLTVIVDGITSIFKSVSDELSELEEIQLVNRCISSDAVQILGDKADLSPGDSPACSLPQSCGLAQLSTLWRRAQDTQKPLSVSWVSSS
ncbi:LOW QUALITY PROTEIN: NLR family CARD domain-containing protein 4 [Aegotheles albertisi]